MMEYPTSVFSSRFSVAKGGFRPTGDVASDPDLIEATLQLSSSSRSTTIKTSSDDNL